MNYSQRAQIEWRWSAETKQCRGLIVDHRWNVVSRPFPKFFSVKQLNGVVPVEPVEAYEKLHGSLGILYFVDGQPRIASRGSFISAQAGRASEMMAAKYPDARFDPHCTHLSKIIYAENHIVVDYGGREALVLLALIETGTDGERPSHAHDSFFPVVRRYEFEELTATRDQIPREVSLYGLNPASGRRSS